MKTRLISQRSSGHQRLLVLLLSVLLLSLSACGSEASIVDEPATPGDVSLLSVEYENALSVEEQLMLGTLALQGTEQEVTSDQATDLLLLWKAYRGLVQDDNVTEAEFDGLLRQIEAAMAEEQLEAIAAMRLVAGDRLELMQALGIEPSFSQGERWQGTGEQEGQAGGPFGGEGRAAGGPPEGLGPGQFGAGGAGQLPEGVDPELIATRQAAREVEGLAGPNRSETMLLEPLIQYLEGVLG